MILLRWFLNLFKRKEKDHLSDPHWWQNADDSDITNETFR